MEVLSTSILTMMLAKREKETSVSTLKVKPLLCVSFHQVINTIERLPGCILLDPVLISVDEYTKMILLWKSAIFHSIQRRGYIF